MFLKSRSDGLRTGFADGFGRRPKNYRGVLNPLRLLLRSEVDAFAEGYSKGYDEGALCRSAMEHRLRTGSATKGGAVSGVNFQQQLESLEALKAFLAQFASDLTDRMEQYN